MDEAFSAQLDAVIRANRLQTTLDEAGVGRPRPQSEPVHDELLRRAAELLRSGTLSRKLTVAEDWLADYERYCNAPPGSEFIWMPETDPQWVVLEQPTVAFQCRGGRNGRTGSADACSGATVAKLNRAKSPGARPLWFYYCPDHLYGRRFVDGVLQVRTLTTITRTR